MKISIMVIIGVLVLAFLAVPVSAATAKSDNGLAQMTPLAGPGPAPGQAPAVGLPNLVVQNYLYNFNHGGSCITDYDGRDNVEFAFSYYYGRETWVKNASPTSATAAYIDCHQTTVASYTGRHPLIRYGMIEYTTWDNPGVRIGAIYFYSGSTFVTSIGQNAYSTPNGARMELTWDLGQWYDFSRGMNQVIRVINTDTDPLHSRRILISGYGARGDF